MVFQLHNYKAGEKVRTPPGFSRWYFNFGATMRWSGELAMKLKYHRLKPGGVPTVFPIFVVVKLKYHRLKPGGVPTFFPIFVVVKLKYQRLKPGGVSHDKTDAYRTFTADRLERISRCVGQRIQHEVGSTCCRHTARGCVQSNP